MLATILLIMCLVAGSTQQEVPCPASCGCMPGSLGPKVLGLDDVNLFKVKCVGIKDLPKSLPAGVNYFEVDCLDRTQLKSLDTSDIFWVESQVTDQFANETENLNTNVTEIENDVGNQTEVQVENLRHISIHQCAVQTLSHDLFSSKYFTNLTTLNLTRNAISQLDNVKFSKLVSLLLIDLSHNSLKRLNGSIFSKLVQLESLIISNNRIQEIDSTSFAGLRNLKELHINNNEISHIQDGTFNDLHRLETLILSRNKMTTVMPETFAGIRSVVSLLLDDNLLTTIHFEGLQTLKDLNLERNRLILLKEGSFVNLTNLRTLFLGQNTMFDIHANALSSLFNLSHLKLDSNRLIQLNPGVFKDLSQLQYLELQHNRLTMVPNKVLNAFTKLQLLNLSSNSIQELKFKDLKFVSRLDLGGNQIVNLTHGAFSGLNVSSMDMLNLQRNRLKHIHQGALPTNTTIQYLDLSVNPSLQTFQPSAFESTRIVHLNLSGCSLRTIPNVIFKSLIPNLLILDVSNNKDELYLPADSFQNSKIQELYLRNTQLSNYGPITVELKPKIFVLDGNDLAHLDALVRLKDMTSLQHLSLRRTMIKDISAEPFANLRFLNFLDLSENDLVFKNVNNITLPAGLKDLKMQKNLSPLTVPEYILSGLILNTLDLSGSTLKSINFVDNIIVNDLIMNDCNIGHILHPNMTFNQPGIHSLSVSQNSLYVVPRVLLQSMTDLFSFRASHNEIDTLFEDDFLNQKKLRYIDLSYNRITKLPSGILKSHKHLSHVDLSHNNIFSVGKDVFPHLPVSQCHLDCTLFLDLSFNQLDILDSDIWGGLTIQSGLDYPRLFLNFINNDIFCNCKSLWLADWFISLHANDLMKEIPKGSCQNLQGNLPGTGRSFLEVLPEDFVCLHPKITGVWRFSLDDTTDGFMCQATGNPAPVVWWQDDFGRILQKSYPSDIKSELQNKAFLTLPHGTRTPQYIHCGASNLKGSELKKVVDVMSLPEYPTFSTTTPSTSPFVDHLDWKLTLILSAVGTFVVTTILVVCITQLCKYCCNRSKKEPVSYTLRKRGGYQVQRANDIIRTQTRPECYDISTFNVNNSEDGEDSGYYQGVGTSGSWVFEATPAHNRDSSSVTGSRLSIADSRLRLAMSNPNGSRSKRHTANQIYGISPNTGMEESTELPELVPYAVHTLDVPKHYGSQRSDLGEPHYDVYDDGTEQTGSRINLIPPDDSEYFEPVSRPPDDGYEPVGEPIKVQLEIHSEDSEVEHSVLKAELESDADTDGEENSGEQGGKTASNHGDNVSYHGDNVSSHSNNVDSHDDEDQVISHDDEDHGSNSGDIDTGYTSTLDNSEYERTDGSQTDVADTSEDDIKGKVNKGFQLEKDTKNEDDTSNDVDTIKISPRYTSMVEVYGDKPIISHTTSFPDIPRK